MLLVLMRRFMKAGILDGISGKALQKANVKKKQNQLKLEDTEVGAKARPLLGKLSPIDQKKDREDAEIFCVLCIFFAKEVAIVQHHPDCSSLSTS